MTIYGLGTLIQQLIEGRGRSVYSTITRSTGEVEGSPVRTPCKSRSRTSPPDQLVLGGGQRSLLMRAASVIRVRRTRRGDPGDFSACSDRD